MSYPNEFFISYRVERIINKAFSRQLSIEKNTNLDDSTTRLDDKATEPVHNMIILSSSKRKERSRREATLPEESSINEITSKVENTPSSRVSNWPSL